MNKEEIERELVRARAAETTIKNNIIELLEQLVEAEKTKRRHGDFGFEGIYERLTLKGFQGQMFSAGSGCCYDQNKHDSHHPQIIFGNIFDLLKEWSDDLEYFEFDVHHCKIDLSNFAHAPIYIAGNWHTLSEAERIWRKLGQMIATLKRRLITPESGEGIKEK